MCNKSIRFSCLLRLPLSSNLFSWPGVPSISQRDMKTRPKASRSSFGTAAPTGACLAFPTSLPRQHVIEKLARRHVGHLLVLESPFFDALDELVVVKRTFVRPFLSGAEIGDHSEGVNDKGMVTVMVKVDQDFENALYVGRHRLEI